jgi:hypothetical protein
MNDRRADRSDLNQLIIHPLRNDLSQQISCDFTQRVISNSKAEDILTAFRRGEITNRRTKFFAGFPINRLAKELRNVW